MNTLIENVKKSEMHLNANNISKYKRYALVTFQCKTRKNHSEAGLQILLKINTKNIFIVRRKILL